MFGVFKRRKQAQKARFLKRYTKRTSYLGEVVLWDSELNTWSLLAVVVLEPKWLGDVRLVDENPMHDAEEADEIFHDDADEFEAELKGEVDTESKYDWSDTDDYTGSDW